MATNDFKPFAIGSGANVMAQADWEALAALVTGFQSGKASSAQVNKAIRQATTFGTVVGQFIADNTGKDVLDDGDTSILQKNLETALSIQAIGRLLNVQVFRSSGTYTPTQGTKKIRFQAWGGGASGGATQITSGNATSSGGGGGAYIEGYIPVLADTKFTATVGAGGGSVNPGTTNGINGGITALGDLFTMTAAGGGSNTFNGYGGTVSANLGTYPELIVIHAYSGGNAMGGVGDSVGGYGGASFGSAPSNPHTTAGEPNFLPGGGGAGGATTGGMTGASGSGGAGLIIIWEYS